MSIDIASVGSTAWTTPVNRTPAPVPSPPAVAADDAAVDVDLLPANPAPELTLDYAIASDAFDRLHATGAHLHFSLDQSTGRVSVQVQDLNGNTKSTISGADALRIAGGAPFN